MPTLRPRTWIGLGIAGLAGLFVLAIQFGTLLAIGSLGWSGLTFQGSLTAAADSLQEGDFAKAQTDFDATAGAADWMVWSSTVPSVNALGKLPGASTAVANWERLAIATNSITDSTGELLALYGDLSGSNGNEKIFNNGAINIERLRELPPRVVAVDAGINNSLAQLERIETQGPFTSGLDRAKNSAIRQILPVQQAVVALRDLAPLLPDALGANGPRRYLVAIANQAEMRASAGAPLSLVMVEFDNGKISIPIKGTTSTDLFPPVNRPVTWWGPSGNPFFAENPRLAPFVRSNTHPNLLYSAREMAGAWQGGDYPEVDGVMVIDLTAIAKVLDATGPITSPVYGEVTGEKLGEILLIEAYQEFGQEDAAARQAANQQLLDDLLSKLLSGDDAVTAARAIASTAPGRHFQVWMRNGRLEALAAQSGAAGIVRDPDYGDWSAVYTQNGNQSKVDVFQQRTVHVTAQLAEDGSARVTQQLTMTNATPADRPEGPPERIGYETSWVRNAYLMYVPDAATNYRTSFPQGFVVRPFKNHQQFGQGFVNDGFGQKLVRIVGWTPPGGQAVVSVSYDLPPGTFAASAGGPVLGDRRLVYRLHADPQAIFNPSVLTVRVTGPAGRVPEPIEGAIITGNTIELSAVQDGPVRIRVPFVRAGE